MALLVRRVVGSQIWDECSLLHPAESANGRNQRPIRKRYIVTVGQVAYEAYIRVWGQMPAWDHLDKPVKEIWETVGRAVYAFYETGIPGAR
jgi:hypothetical protein